MNDVIQEYDGSLGRVLSRAGGAGDQLFHGDWEGNPDVRDTFSGNAARRAWMARQELETPPADGPDLQAWTHVADYSVHPDSPLTSIKGSLKICARITGGNRLQFGVFRQTPSARSVRRRVALARIPAGDGLVQLRHGSIPPVMRIAGKSEAEARLLDDGKLRQSANPKFAGLLMDCGHAKVRIAGTFKNNGGSREYGPFYSMIPYFGHIWSYWYTIEGNVLYFVGLPLYTDNRKGTIVHTYSGSLGDDGEWRYSSKRTSVDLPPTLDDLKSGGFSPARVRDASFTSAPGSKFRDLCDDIWGLGGNQFGLAGEEVRLEHLLGKLLSRTPAPRVVLQRALARITETGGAFTIRQLEHGDIYAPLTALGFKGGVFGGAVAERDDVSCVSSLPAHGGPVSSGTSGYIPSRSRFSLANKSVDFAQAFRVARYGCGYFIDIKGGFRPFANYHEEEDLPAYDVSLTCNLNAQGDYPPPPWPGPDPMPDPDDEDDDDHEKPGHIDLGDLGFWYQAASGVSVSAKRDRDDKSVLRYIFTVEVTQNVTLQHKLVYNVTAHFAVADGGSYPVLDNGSVTMWYWLTSSPGEVTVHNLTSSSWSGAAWVANEHPDSASDFVLSVFRTAYMTAQFDPTDLRSDAPFQSGNIISFHRTGRTKRVGGSIRSAPGARSRYAYGRMEVVEIQLNPAIVKQVLRNFAIKNAPQEVCTVSPSSIRGDSQGAAAGDPVVSVSAPATAKNASAYPQPGATKATGPIPMYVIGSFGSAVASYSVQGDFSGWFEGSPTNRKNASISGQFDVTVPARRINRQPA